eukprot:15485826-Alexandrium_andersonii.AAC.1
MRLARACRAAPGPGVLGAIERPALCCAVRRRSQPPLAAFRVLPRPSSQQAPRRAMADNADALVGWEAT